MWPDRVSNPGPLTYESGSLPTALRGPAYHPAIIEILLKRSKIAIHPSIFKETGSLDHIYMIKYMP